MRQKRGGEGDRQRHQEESKGMGKSRAIPLEWPVQDIHVWGDVL